MNWRPTSSFPSARRSRRGPVRSCPDIWPCRRSSRIRTIPATVSKNILTGLLRDELKFKGLVVTDAMDMGGVTNLFPPGEAAVRAVLAGADVLLMPPVPDAAMSGLERAVKSKRISTAAHRRFGAANFAGEIQIGTG